MKVKQVIAITEEGEIVVLRKNVVDYVQKEFLDEV